MKTLITLILLIFCLQGFAQTNDTTKYVPNASYGYKWNRGKYTYSLNVPVFNHGGDTTSKVPGELVGINNSLYICGLDGHYHTAGAGIDSIYITNTDSIFIISGNDTIYVGNSLAGMDSAYQRSDSIFGLKNGTEFFISLAGFTPAYLYGDATVRNFVFNPAGLDVHFGVDTIGLVATKWDLTQGGLGGISDTTLLEDATYDVDSLSHAPSGSPSAGHNLLAYPTTTGGFALQHNNIAEYGGSSYTYVHPFNGATARTLYNSALNEKDATYQYDSANDVWNFLSYAALQNGNFQKANLNIGTRKNFAFTIRTNNKTRDSTAGNGKHYDLRYPYVPQNNFYYQNPVTHEVLLDSFSLIPYDGISTHYWGGDSAFHPLPTVSGTANSLTVNSSGSGNASPFTFDGSVAKTLSYNSIGAQPQLNGTGFVKASGTTISYDNSTYLTSTDITGKADKTTTISTTAPLTGGGDLSANRTFAITQATTSTNGYLSSTDWNTFNGKQSALSGTGYGKWSGTTPSYLTPTQVTADLNLFTSSLQGLVPSSGGSARKVLHADGNWYDTTAASGGGSSGGVTSDSFPTYYGTLQAVSTFVSTGYTLGTSVTISGGKVLFSATNPTASNDYTYNYYTQLERWRTAALIQITTKSATQGFAYVGMKSTVSPNPIDANVEFDGSTGTNSGKILINGLTTIMSTSALSFSANDSIFLTIERRQDTLIATATNVTTHAAPISVRFIYSFTTSLTLAPHNVGHFFVRGGGITLDSLNISSQCVKNGSWAVLADSKFAYQADDFAHTSPRQLQQNYPTLTILGGGSNKVSDLLNIIPEITALHPYGVLIQGIGTNDSLNGVAAATWRANYVSLVSQLQAAGMKVRINDAIFDSVASNGIAAWVDATFPDSNIIYTNAAGRYVPGVLYTDKIHPSQLGHNIVYQTDINSMKLKFGRPYQPFNYFTGPINGDSAVFTSGILTSNNVTAGLNTGSPGVAQTAPPTGEFLSDNRYTPDSSTTDFKVTTARVGTSVSGISQTQTMFRIQALSGNPINFFAGNLNLGRLNSSAGLTINGAGTFTGNLTATGNLLLGNQGTGGNPVTGANMNYISVGRNFVNASGFGFPDIIVFDAGSPNQVGLGFNTTNGLWLNTYSSGYPITFAPNKTETLTIPSAAPWKISGTAGTAYQKIRVNTGATGMEFYGGGQTIDTWTSITATTKTMVAGEGYISTSTSNAQLVYTLPTTATVGQIFAVTGGSGTGGWKINQNASQVIKIGASTTTTGTGGSLVSGTQYDAVELICIVANTTFIIRTHEGTFTFN